MKRKLTFIIAFAMASLLAFSQQIEEPEFIGEVLLIENDSAATLLEKKLVTITVKADATMYIFGMGKVKEKVEVDGEKSPIRVKAGKLKMIVRSSDNQSDPMSIISLFQFEVKKGKRKVMTSTVGTFTGAKSGNTTSVYFSAKKYGESSYILTIPSIEPGEYGFTVANPNNKDEKTIVVSAFGVD